MQNYHNVRRFLELTHPPVDADAVLLRSTMFRNGRTFGRYIARFAKEAILLRYITGRITPDVKSASTGLKNAHALSFRFQNFMMVGAFPRLSGRAEWPLLLDRRHFTPCFPMFEYQRRRPN